MAAVPPGVPPGTDVLIRKVDAYLAVVRPALVGAERDLAERLAACLRELITGTTAASAADRARVRAAVHCLVLRRGGLGRSPQLRSLTAAQQVINSVVRQLGRPDLVVLATPDGAGGAEVPPGHAVSRGDARSAAG